MGSGFSTHCINNEFLNDNKRQENFLQTLAQCSKDDRLPISQIKSIYSDHKETDNFVLMCKGPIMTPRLWHSSNLFVCAISTPNPPIQLGYCAFHQYHSLPFISIHLDAISYCHLVYFMNRARFYLEQDELLDCIVFCDRMQDEECLAYVATPSSVPHTDMPLLKLTIPYDSETGGLSEAPFYSSSVMAKDAGLSSSAIVALSEPSSMNQLSSTSILPGISEPLSMNDMQSSSFMPGVSEPLSMNSEITGSSSVFHDISEPSSIANDYMSSLSSVLNPISEPSTMNSSAFSSQSSIFNPISEPSGINSSSASSAFTSQFGLVSEPQESSSLLSTQFGLISEPNLRSMNSSQSSFFGLVSEPNFNSGTGSQSSFFGLVSEPFQSNSEDDFNNQSHSNTQRRSRSKKSRSETSSRTSESNNSRKSSRNKGKS